MTHIVDYQKNTFWSDESKLIKKIMFEAQLTMNLILNTLLKR